MNRRKTLLTTSLLTLAFGVAPASLWIFRHRLSQGKRPSADLSLSEAQVVSAAERQDETTALDKIFTKENKLSYKGFLMEKSQSKEDETWFATLRKGDRVLAKFEQGGEKDWTSFGLFPFLGDGAKQLVIEQYSGGAHCCYSDWIYDLSGNPRVVYDNEKYGTGNLLSPVDLDGDGKYELKQSVMAFDYFHLSHASSVFPEAIFAYDQKAGEYRPANRKFSAHVLRDIGKDLKELETLKGESDKSDEGYSDNYFSAVLQVTLKYIYAGEREKGWAFFNQEYKTHTGIAKEKMRAEINEVLRGEPIYTYIYSHETE